MQLKSLSEILTCINNWQSLRDNVKELSGYLARAKSFTYTIKTAENSDFHFYPGVCFETRKLYMFLISAAEDREQDEDALYHSIIQAEVNLDLGNSDRIPEKEARDRIANWHDKCSSWIETEHKAGKAIFEAFNVPASYMTNGWSYYTFFALKADATPLNTGRMVADLVTTPISAEITDAFFDFVRPVPPFDPLHFYLLSRAGK